MLERIHAAVAHHERTCDLRSHAILLNPGNWGLIGWDEVLGLPVLPDKRIEPKRFEVVCGSAIGGRLGVYPVVWDADGTPRLFVAKPGKPERG